MDQNLFFSQQEHLAYSISSDFANGDYFNTPINFDEFMIFNEECIGNGMSFDFDGVTSATSLEYSYVIGNAPAVEETAEALEENNGDCDSSGTTTTKGAKPKRDRSKTIVSERRRRGRMKEKLYELRSLVPNITKMDKASIIADAVVYVQDLQNQAKKLMEEVAMLESSMKENQVLQLPIKKALRSEQVEASANASRVKVLRVMTHEVGEGKFYVKIECSKGNGAASSLYLAIESLSCFDVDSSDFSVKPDRIILALTLKNNRELAKEMSVSSVKLWVMGALLKQGFEFERTMIP